MTRFRTARTHAGLTQAALAAKSGVDQATISRIEAGQVAEPAYRTVVCLCRALDVDPSTIAEFHVSVCGAKP